MRGRGVGLPKISVEDPRSAVMSDSARTRPKEVRILDVPHRPTPDAANGRRMRSLALDAPPLLDSCRCDPLRGSRQ
jgi:hypothetical protein